MKNVVKLTQEFSLTSCIVAASLLFAVNISAAEQQPLALLGQWRFNEDASDSYKKVLRSLTKQLAIQKSFEYPARQAENGANKMTPKGVLANVPQFLFATDNLQLQLNNNNVQIKQGKHLRQVSLQAASKSFSLKQFTGNTLTTVANIADEHLFIDSTTSGGLFIGEEFYLDKEQRLIQKLRISDGIHESLYLQRVYLRCEHLCNPKESL